MLRHSREHTYWVNKKNKERDKTHTGVKSYYDMPEEDYLKRRNRFNLRDYLRRAWNIQL